MMVERIRSNWNQGARSDRRGDGAVHHPARRPARRRDPRESSGNAVADLNAQRAVSGHRPAAAAARGVPEPVADRSLELQVYEMTRTLTATAIVLAASALLGAGSSRPHRQRRSSRARCGRRSAASPVRRRASPSPTSSRSLGRRPAARRRGRRRRAHDRARPLGRPQLRARVRADSREMCRRPFPRPRRSPTCRSIAGGS